MGHVDVAHLEYYLPDGRVLLGDVSFRVGEGAVIGPHAVLGAGSTVAAGEEVPPYAVLPAVPEPVRRPATKPS